MTTIVANCSVWHHVIAHAKPSLCGGKYSLFLLWDKERIMVFQELFDVIPVLLKRAPFLAQPLLQLVRMSAHLLAKFGQGKPVNLFVPG
jgi:hypothetical protein